MRRSFLKGMTSQTTLILAVVVGFFIAVGAIWWFGSTQASVGRGTGPIGGGIVVTQKALLDCPSVALTAEGSARNHLSSAKNASYVATTMAVVPIGQSRPIVTGITTPGSSRTATSLTVPCVSDEVYTNGVEIVYHNGTTGSYTSTKSDVLKYVKLDSNGGVISKSNSVKFDGLIEGTSTLVLTVRSTADNTNASDSSDNAVTDSSAQAMSQGVPRSRFLTMWVRPSESQFGSSHSGGVISIDTVNSSVFGDSDIAIQVESAPSGWNIIEVNCLDYPNTRNQRSANRCYAFPKIPSNFGEEAIKLRITMNPSLGEPFASADPIIYIDDINYGSDTDGSIINDAFDAGGNNFGAGTNSYTADNS